MSTYSSSQLTDEIYKGNFDAFQWGWYVEPDPDSMLSYMTCGQRQHSSDSFYCNKEYDKLYNAAARSTDHAQRVEQIKKMQEIVYRDAPYLVTAYSSIGEAVRSDRFACLVAQPNPGGIWLEQYGVYNYIHMKPAAEASTCDAAPGAHRRRQGLVEQRELVLDRAVPDRWSGPWSSWASSAAVW